MYKKPDYLGAHQQQPNYGGQIVPGKTKNRRRTELTEE
jgi:centrin-3